MITVACVLRSGGEYRPEHVALLREGVRRHLASPHKFVCLSDRLDVGADEVLPLLNDWPGWWAKMELFDGRLTPPVLYLDLDTVVTGPLDGLAGGSAFTVLRNFLFPDRIGSGMMAWTADLSRMHKFFAQRPAGHIRRHATAVRWGDQSFIREHSPVLPSLWQDVHPGRVVSFKVHCVPAGRVPPGAAVVCFHGRPRPWNISVTQRGWFDIGDASSVHGELRLAGAGE